MDETKPFKISKQTVKIAFERVKANKGTYGIDEQSIADFEDNLKDNLYKIWNRKYFTKIRMDTDQISQQYKQWVC